MNKTFDTIKDNTLSESLEGLRAIILFKLLDFVEVETKKLDIVQFVEVKSLRQFLDYSTLNQEPLTVRRLFVELPQEPRRVL